MTSCDHRDLTLRVAWAIQIPHEEGPFKRIDSNGILFVNNPTAPASGVDLLSFPGSPDSRASQDTTNTFQTGTSTRRGESRGSSRRIHELSQRRRSSPGPRRRSRTNAASVGSDPSVPVLYVSLAPVSFLHRSPSVLLSHRGVPKRKSAKKRGAPKAMIRGESYMQRRERKEVTDKKWRVAHIAARFLGHWMFKLQGGVADDDGPTPGRDFLMSRNSVRSASRADFPRYLLMPCCTNAGVETHQGAAGSDELFQATAEYYLLGLHTAG